jgi:hypothetical protein
MKAKFDLTKYENKSQNSGVVGYKITTDAIAVWFKDRPQPYIYSYNSAGKQNIEKMKKLAIRGKGLSSFISRYVKNNYEH